jgi:hypothetical protein
LSQCVMRSHNGCICTSSSLAIRLSFAGMVATRR